MKPAGPAKPLRSAGGYVPARTVGRENARPPATEVAAGRPTAGGPPARTMRKDSAREARPATGVAASRPVADTTERFPRPTRTVTNAKRELGSLAAPVKRAIPAKAAAGTIPRPAKPAVGSGARPARPATATKPARPARPAAKAEGDGKERLHKLLAQGGVASRRSAEEVIEQGRVTVNGHVIKEMGFKADPVRDHIVVDGHPLKLRSGPATVVLLHKPKGYVTTKNDPEDRPTVLALLPQKYHYLHPVGRLDYDTSGILLFTDDGTLTNLLTHPSHGVTKTYLARVRGPFAIPKLKELEAGVYLEDGKTAPCRAKLKAQTKHNAQIEITLHEGRNRQVRRMLESVGHPVRALRRVKFAELDLSGVPSGGFRVLLPGEVHQLRKIAEAGEKLKPRVARKPLKPRKPYSIEKPEVPEAAPQVKYIGKKAHPLAKRIDRQWGGKTRRDPN